MAGDETFSNDLVQRLIGIHRRKSLPDRDRYLKLLDRVNFILLNEDEGLRPYDGDGLPGGIINLRKTIPTVIVPDLVGKDVVLQKYFQNELATPGLADDLFGLFVEVTLLQC